MNDFGKEMDITRYTSYFHDGEILAITHINNNIEMVLKSAEVDATIVNDVALSMDNRIKGKLHIIGVNLIMNNGVKFNEKMKLLFRDNDLLHLKINENIVFCEIGWRGTNLGEIDFSDLEIHATSIWWENIPDLYDPFT